MKCKTCNKDLKGPWQKIFCSASCSATFNNKGIRRHGKAPDLICPKCNSKKLNYSKLCNKCENERKHQKSLNRTINEISYDNGVAKTKFVKVRNIAKKLMKRWNIPYKCYICNYELHVDVCHIKPISCFNPKTKIKIVNSKNNLVYLCKNHHWEFDNGFLKFNLPE